MATSPRKQIVLGLLKANHNLGKSSQHRCRKAMAGDFIFANFLLIFFLTA